MIVSISGSHGLVGSALREHYFHVPNVKPLFLDRARTEWVLGTSEVPWNPEGGLFDARPLEGSTAVVHLAGEGIAARRWSARQKERIRRSRVDGTRHLVEGLKSLKAKPSVLVCASAIGIYGHRGDEVLDESSPPASDFLADVCREWEAEASKAKDLGLRVVLLRLGIVLSPNGGALKKMLPPFRLGVGGRLASGRQWMSWVHLSDVVRAIHFAVETASLSGPANVTAPTPVTNREFTKILGRVLHRPTLFPAPGFALRAGLGEMAGALLLSSQRVLPRKLLAAGFSFQFASLEPALRDLVGRRRAAAASAGTPVSRTPIA